jgi:hypothetical protein
VGRGTIASEKFFRKKSLKSDFTPFSKKKFLGNFSEYLYYMNLQESIYRIKQMMGLNEGLHDTSWEDDKGNKVTLLDLLKATDHLPVQRISVERLKDKLLTWDGDNSEINKIDMADLEYPILIFVDDEGNILSIIDGHHRVHKAIRRGLETIKCKLIPINSLPDNIRVIFNHIN